MACSGTALLFFLLSGIHLRFSKFFTCGTVFETGIFSDTVPLLKIDPSIHPSSDATAQIGPWPPLLRFRKNKVLRCEVVSLTTNLRYLWGTHDFLLGFTPLAKGSSFKALETRPPSHSHLLHNPLYIASGPPRGVWESEFAGRTCRLNTQEVFWHLTGHAYWHQNAPPEPYQPSVQSQNW
jgi:hypothetical protein